MSHVAYDLQLSDAMNDLQEQVKVEHAPTDKNEHGVENSELWGLEERFSHYAVLYIKYIEIYRKLEECYDQIVHPQKRIFIKKVLESTICRICEIKKYLVFYNFRAGSMYVHLDGLLFDLKYDPSVIEIPVPRYFREDDNIPVDIVFKEKVVREGGKKKKKGGGKKKKGKKKKSGDDDAPKKKVLTQNEKETYIDQVLLKRFETTEPVEEVAYDPFTLDLEITSAIRLIQKNERGRQGRGRYLDALQKITSAIKTNDIRKRMHNGKMQAPTKQEAEEQSAEVVQCQIRGILARKTIEKMRQEEMIFLGMQRKPKTEEEKKNDPIKASEKTQADRKNIQEDHWDQFQEKKKDLIEEIKGIEGDDIVDSMLKQRRDWVQWYRSTFGKVPDNLEKFYQKANLETPLSPEEEEKAKAEEEEKSKKKGGKDKGKGKAKKKGGGGDDDDGGEKLLKIGPTEVVQKFDEFYEDYTGEWANRDERDNKDQQYDRQMARDEVMPVVQKEYQKDVDEMIKMELENLKLQLSGGKKKKGKGKKKKKKGRKGKKKPNKLPGARYIRDMTEYDMLVELVKNGVVKKLPPANLKDFIGEFNYIHMMMEDLNDRPREPSMALIRQLVTEYIIFPLGSALVRKRFPEHCRSFLFYGPAGTGKTLVVRAIAAETRSVVFDLSPLSIEGVFANDRRDSEKMVAMVMTAAKEYAPSLIYIDECEKIWPAKKKKKKGQKKAKKNDMKNPARIKTALNKWKPKWITDETRITIVGCTSEPHEGSKKEFKKFFDRSIYFPFPDYTTRRLMWKVFIENAGGRLKADFQLSTLAHISEGYSAGSIKKTCENVLTKFRKERLDQRPLTLAEFIGPLSLCGCAMDDQWKEFQNFTGYISSDDLRRAKIQTAQEGEDGGDPKKAKKGGKKKKK